MKAEREKDTTFDGDRFKHPSYGQINFSRVSGHANLYGSSINHNNFIKLEISESEHVRHLSQDSYFSKGRIIEINLSSAQFAELITTLNMGSGVPCTIAWREGQGHVDPCPQYSAKQEFDNEFKKDMKELSTIVDDSMSKVEEMLKGSSIKKGDLREVENRLYRLKQQLASNIPFVGDQFTRHVDRSVSQAKAEVDSMITHAITQVGIKHIKEGELLQIEGDKK